MSGCRVVSLLAIAVAQPAVAQQIATDYHAAPSGEIVVTAPFQRDRQDILSGVAVLQGPELGQAVRPTIGETLAKTPGVSATSFGPNASRPVLRGLQGERVRVLTDGIGSIDVSNTSVDHAVVVDPLLAERIEVLRGPEALLYGSSAIGGVVNVIDKRIPRAVPDESVHLDTTATYGTAANERSIAGAADAGVAGKLVLHVDGSYQKTDDLDIGGHVLSRPLRAQALAASQLPPDQQVDAEGAPVDFAATAALRGTLPNSAGRTWTAGAGASLVTDTGHIGVAYSHYDSVYGVPIRYATQPGQAQEAPRLDLRQNRLDARAEFETGGGFLQSVRARAAYAQYRHYELEADGTIGTAFYNKGMEGRIELVQAQHGAWKGASGGQVFIRDFDAVGAEAFVPKNRTEQVGLFTLQQLDYGRLKLEAGGRYEHSVVKALPVDRPRFLAGGRRYDSVSASAGASYGLGERWRVGANVSRTVRAPSAEELFANGPHGGTEAYEMGDPDFAKERAVSVEGVLRGSGTGYSVEASVYYNWFDNFIYEDQTGAIADGLPVYQFRQAKARFYGFEAQGSATLARVGAVELKADGLADYVHAEIVDFGPAPRIPPLRLLGGLAATSRWMDVRGEVEWVDHQRRVSPYETATGSYTLVNAEASIRPWRIERPISILLSANNIFDVAARRHASFLKDFAPLSGRDFRVTIRTSF